MLGGLHVLAILALAFALADFSVALALARQIRLALIPVLTLTGLLATGIGGLFVVTATSLAFAGTMRRQPEPTSGHPSG